MNPTTLEPLATQAPVRDGLLLNFVGGSWEEGSGTEREDVLDPASAAPLISTVRASAEDAARALQIAADAKAAWGATTVFERAQVLLTAARILRERVDEIARTMTMEEGKTYPESKAEVVRTAETIEVMAGLAYRPRGEVHPGHRPHEQLTFTLNAPLGVVVVLAPWNFPLLLPAAKVAAALLAGNTVVFKPSEYTPVTAAVYTAILAEAGLPDGVLNLVLGRGSVVGPALLRAPANAVSMTGGNTAGKIVAAAAVEHGLKYQLELGGNNPVVVLADANLELAAKEIVLGAMGSTGQKCTATRRIYAVPEVHEELHERVATIIGSMRLGHGMDDATAVGPLISESARDDFEEAVGGAEATGATVQRFGDVPDEGYFSALTLVRDADKDNDFFKEEVFGPMTTLFEIADLDEGIARANDTAYGLSASIFTSSFRSGLRFCEGVDAGMLHVNSQTTGAEPSMPFGGMKASSNFSREMGRFSLDFFTQLKSVYMEDS
jgi:acyl-CoA reductase-like NAD-dependent aldehyde dehydrogenase